MKNQLMVLTKVLDLAIKVARSYGPYVRRTADIDYKLLVHAGWKPGAARGISHGVFAGSVGNYLKSGNELNDNETSYEHGYKTSTPSKARGGYKRNSGKGYSARRRVNKRCRCARPRKYYTG